MEIEELNWNQSIYINNNSTINSDRRKIDNKKAKGKIQIIFLFQV